MQTFKDLGTLTSSEKRRGMRTVMRTRTLMRPSPSRTRSPLSAGSCRRLRSRQRPGRACSAVSPASRPPDSRASHTRYPLTLYMFYPFV